MWYPAKDMKITRDIQSVSDFKQNASKLIKQVRETKQPIVLTVNGRAAVVVQDAESYEQMVEADDKAEILALLRERREYVKGGGKLIAADDAFAVIAKKYGISFD